MDVSLWRRQQISDEEINLSILQMPHGRLIQRLMRISTNQRVYVLLFPSFIG